MTQKLFELTLTQSILGRPVVNRFNFVGPAAASGLGGAAGLLSATGANAVASNAFPSGSLLRNISDVQTHQIVFQQAICISVYDPTDFATVQWAQTVTGQIGLALLSPVAAWGFRTNQVRRDIRRGHKRFGGVPSDGAPDGADINSSYTALLSTLAASLTANITSLLTGDTASYAPVIVKKTKYAVPNTPTSDPDFAYHYDPVESVQMGKLAYGCNWGSYAVLRNQVSRQVVAH